MLVMATTSKRSVMKQLDLYTQFNDHIAVPNVNSHEELAHILRQSGAFERPDQAIEELRGLTRSESVGVGIKTVLNGIEKVRNDPDISGRFANVIASAVAEQGFS